MSVCEMAPFGFPCEMLKLEAPPPSRRIQSLTGTPAPQKACCAAVRPFCCTRVVRRYRSRLLRTIFVPAIGLLLASSCGPNPPWKPQLPPKLEGLMSLMLTPRTRPPNLKVCMPCCFCINSFNSQRLFVLLAWPTCEPPPLKELLTLSPGIVLLPFCWLRLCEY